MLDERDLFQGDQQSHQRNIFEKQSPDSPPKSDSQQNRRRPLIKRDTSGKRIQALNNKGDPIFYDQNKTDYFKNVVQAKVHRSPGPKNENSFRFVEAPQGRYPAFPGADLNLNVQYQGSSNQGLPNKSSDPVFENGGESTPRETFEQGLQTANFNFSLAHSSKQPNEAVMKTESKTEDFRKEPSEEYLNRRERSQQIQITANETRKDTKNPSTTQIRENLQKRRSPQKQLVKPVLQRKTSDIPAKSKNNTLLPAVESGQRTASKEANAKNSEERISLYAHTNNDERKTAGQQQQLLDLAEQQGEDQFSSRSGNYQLSSNLSTGQPNTRRSQKILNDYFQSAGNNARPIGASLRSNSHAARGSKERQKDAVNVPIKNNSAYTKTYNPSKQQHHQQQFLHKNSLRTDANRQVVTTASTSISQKAGGGLKSLTEKNYSQNFASQVNKTINVRDIYDSKQQVHNDQRQSSSEYLKPLRGGGAAGFRPTRNRTTDTHQNNIISSQSQDLYKGSIQKSNNVYVSPLKRDQMKGTRVHVSEQRPMHRSHADQRIRPLVISNSGGPVSRENQRNQLKTQKLYGDTLAGKGSTRQIQKSLLSGQLAASANQITTQNNLRQLVQSSMPQISMSFKGSTQIPTLKKNEKSVTKKRIPKSKKEEVQDNFPKDELLVTFFDKKMVSKDQQTQSQVQSQGRKRAVRHDEDITLIDKDETRRQIQMQGTYNNRQTAGHGNPAKLMADFSDRGDRDWEPEARKSVKSEMVRNLMVGQRRADTISHVETKNLFQNEEMFDSIDQRSANAHDDLNSQWPSQKLNSMLFKDKELQLPVQHSNSVENQRKMPPKNFNQRVQQYKTESVPSETLSQKSDLQATDINKLHPQGLYLGKDSRKTSTQKLNLKRNSISCQQKDSGLTVMPVITREKSDEKPTKKKDMNGLYIAQNNQMLVQECASSQSDIAFQNGSHPFGSIKNEEEQSVDNLSSNSIKQNFKYFQGRIHNQRSNNNSFEKHSPLTRTFEFNGKGQKARMRKLPSQINALQRKQSDLEADRESQRSLVESANQLIRAQQENRLQFLQSAGSFGSMESHGSGGYAKEFKSNPNNFQIQKWNQDNSPNLQNQQNQQKFSQFFVNTSSDTNKVKGLPSQPFNLSQTNPSYNQGSFWDQRIGIQPAQLRVRGAGGAVNADESSEQLVNFYDPETSLLELSQEVNLISASAQSTLTNVPLQHHQQTHQGQSPYNPRFLTNGQRSAGNQRCLNTLNGSYNTIKINGQTKGGSSNQEGSMMSNGFPMMDIANSHSNQLNQSHNQITASQLENSVDLSRSFNTIQNGHLQEDNKQMTQNEAQNPFKKGPKLHLYKKSRRIKTSSAARQIQTTEHSQTNAINLTKDPNQQNQLIKQKPLTDNNSNTTTQVTRQASRNALQNEQQIQSQIQSASGNINIDQFLAKASNNHDNTTGLSQNNETSKLQKVKNSMGIQVSKDNISKQQSVETSSNRVQSDKSNPNPYITQYRKNLDHKLRPHTTENNVNMQIVGAYQNEIQVSQKQQFSPKPVQRIEKLNNKQMGSNAPYANAPYFQMQGSQLGSAETHGNSSRNKNNQSQKSRESVTSSRKEANHNKLDTGSLIQTAKFSTGSQSHFETFRQNGLKAGEPQHSYLLEDYGAKQSRKTFSGQSRSSANQSQHSGGKGSNLSKNRNFLTKITNNSFKLAKKESIPNNGSSSKNVANTNNTPVQIAYDVKPYYKQTRPQQASSDYHKALPAGSEEGRNSKNEDSAQTPCFLKTPQQSDNANWGDSMAYVNTFGKKGDELNNSGLKAMSRQQSFKSNNSQLESLRKNTSKQSNATHLLNNHQPNSFSDALQFKGNQNESQRKKVSNGDFSGRKKDGHPDQQSRHSYK